MQGERLKEYLLQIAGQVNEKTELEDIYQQLALLDDIDRAEAEEREGETLSSGRNGHSNNLNGQLNIFAKSKDWSMHPLFIKKFWNRSATFHTSL